MSNVSSNVTNETGAAELLSRLRASAVADTELRFRLLLATAGQDQRQA